MQIARIAFPLFASIGRGCSFQAVQTLQQRHPAHEQMHVFGYSAA